MNGHSPLSAEQELGLLSPPFHRNNQPAAMTCVNLSRENCNSCEHGSVSSAGMESLRSGVDEEAEGPPASTPLQAGLQHCLAGSHSHSIPPSQYDHIPPSSPRQQRQAGTWQAFLSEKGSDSHPISHL